MRRLPMHAVLLAIAGRRRPGCAPLAAQNQNQQPEIELVIGGDPALPPRYAVPDFVAASPDAAEIAKTISQVLWDDLGVRARVLPHPARHLLHRAGGALARAGAVRVVARARRRRGVLRLGAAQRRQGGRSRCGSSTSARASRCSPRSTAARRRTRASTPTPSPTRCTSSSARCAAWRAPSSRSSPTATASACSARSTTARSRRSTSPTTTAPTSAASPPRGSSTSIRPGRRTRARWPIRRTATSRHRSSCRSSTRACWRT